MQQQYDVIVVGARCAGASLGTFLAGDGMDVLIIDADPLPSDMVMSTHVVEAPGVAVLDELGVLDGIRQATPAVRSMRLQVEDVVIDVTADEDYQPIAPRRILLDTLLQDAAVAAGAELRERTKLVGLLWEQGRVCGVRVTRNGAESSIRARLVVGADGRRSTLARLAGAYEYFEYEAPRPGYWAYWPEPEWLGTERGGDYDLYMGLHGDRIRFIFRADSNLVLLCTTAPVPVFEGWRAGDHRAAYIEDLRQDAQMAPIIEGAEPVSSVRGAYRERYGFRQGAGPGWALVGDAGVVKDPTLGQGITDALLQAKLLAAAIREDSDAALERYWHRRDVETLPLFRYAEDWGAGDDVTEFERVVFGQLQRDPRMSRVLVDLLARRVDPYEALPTAKVARWTLGAMMRGRFDVAREFFVQGKRQQTVRQQVADRQRLLDLVAEDRPRAVVGAQQPAGATAA